MIFKTLPATVLFLFALVVCCLFGATLVAQAQTDPMNRTGGSGEDPLSRNFNWSVPLANLSGRAGLDLGLSLSYNSLATWRKSGTQISFDNDHGNPSPGFRLGFPVIQAPYLSAETGKQTYLLISPDGSRKELRQVGSTALYESADSSYLLLDSASMTLKTTDGTQLSFALQGSDYQCTKIKDRNGNFITINYVSGRIDTVVDTLARTVKFNYDVSNLLTSISQVWTVNGLPATRYWARFTYSNLTISTNFTGLTNLGPQNGAIIKVLTRVTLIDDSRFDFDYTTWGQVWKIRNSAADGHLLNYRSYDLPLNNSIAQTDCPRFTQRRDWAENWNRTGSVGPALLPTGAEQEVVTTFAAPTSTSWTLPDGTPQTGMRAQVTSPDGTYNQIYFPGSAGSSGWHRGLSSLVETYDSGNTRQRQSVTTWTQDNTALSYILNPRVTETNVYDPAGNRARTRVTYQTVSLPDGTGCKLPQDVFEYQANATTVLRRTHTDYNLNSPYTTRRIIGLVSDRTLYGVDPVTQVETLTSKVGFLYDETGSIYGNDLPVQHDNTGYTSAFVAGRANLSSVKRYDVTNTTLFVTSRWKYNTAGGVVASIDPLNHQTSVDYDDSFSDGNNSRNTHAYPTTVTDADGFASAAQYNFDFGAVTRTQGPPPAGHSTGAIKHFIYDSMSRIEKVAIEFNGDTDYSYVRFTYPTSQNRVDTYATIQDGLGESHSFKVSDGHGRLIASASDHPGSVGGFSGQLTLFDTMGRAVKTSNPTETNASGSHLQWVAAGDDASASWRYTQQTYDWKGRPLVTTNTDTTTKAASYGGCGCAGGEVVTVTDEGTLSGGVAKKRQQKIYADVLGRTVKTEVLNWNGAGAFGTGGTVYSAVVNFYNSRDQVTSVKQYVGAATGDGSCPSGTCQQTTMTYDGHARLKTQHVPEQNAGTFTTYNYNSDDTVSSVADARGATQTLTYNARHLVTGISYTPPAGITDTPNVAFAYDAAGNRTSMTDGIGSTTYAYNQLSRMTSETRSFTGLAGSFTLTYAYNLAGELTSLTDPFGALVGYNYDRTGRLSGVTGSGFAGVSTYASSAQYRAWGAIKSLSYGNSKTLAVGYNGALQPTSYEVPGVLKKSYQYYNDGKLKFTQDQLITNSKYDRSYEYDHMGRVTKALSGAEARGQGPTEDRPYNETLTYDALEHLTAKEAYVWDGYDTTGVQTFTNNRVQGWIYDADGRGLSTSIGYYTYDAAGRVISFGDDDPFKTEQLFNGDGGRAKTIARRYDEGLADFVTEKITYYLTSTVLGGELVTELSEQGVKERTLVRTGGSVLASQVVAGGVSSVVWEHADSSGASRRTTNASGQIWSGSLELDAVGANAGLAKPFTWTVPDKLGLPVIYPEIVDMITNPGGGCVADGMSIPCAMVNNNNSLECPDGNCGPRNVYNPLTKTKQLTPLTQNRNNGQLGYWPNGSSGPGVVIGSSGSPTWVTVSTEASSAYVWRWICYGGQCEFAPEPTAYGGNSYFVQTGFNSHTLSLPQQRSDLKGASKVPDINIKREYLTPCVQRYLSKFFGGQSLAGIEIQRDYLPPIAPNDARAFTNTGSLISFNKGEYQPNTKRGIELIGHEVAHNFQARKYGDAIFATLYLGDSAALLYQFKNLDMAYLGNRFEREAFALQAEIERDLAKNGNPCPP